MSHHDGSQKFSAWHFCGFLMAGLGCSMMDQALFGSLEFFGAIHGPQILLWMNASSRLAAIPVLLLQSKFDYYIDRHYGSATAFRLRQAVSLVCVALCGIGVSQSYQSLPVLLVLTALAGASGIFR
jgi:hypothetical protein